MSNHTFNFAEVRTNEEYEYELQRNLELLKDLSLSFSDEEIKQLAVKNTDKWFKMKDEVAKIAREIDIPEEYTDVWLIYEHYDNDFAFYFDKINWEIAKKFVSYLKNSIQSVAFERYHGIDSNDVSPRIERDIKRGCKSLLNEEHYIDMMKHGVAFEAACVDCNNKGFHDTFESTLEYFSHSKGKIYVGRKNEALAHLTKIKFDKVDEVTEENFNKMWWNGDVSIIHIKNGEIFSNFNVEYLED